MKDGFELVRGFEERDLQTGSYIWEEILRPVLALQISAAIICEFESNKQTKHNLFLAHSQISLLHRFPRLQSQSAISFPGKRSRRIRRREKPFLLLNVKGYGTDESLMKQYCTITQNIVMNNCFVISITSAAVTAAAQSLDPNMTYSIESQSWWLSGWVGWSWSTISGNQS